MKQPITYEILLPEFYYTLSEATFKRFARGYIEANYPGFKPVRIKGKKIVIEWEGNHEKRKKA